MIKDIFAGTHDSVKKRKILTIFASILLITAIVGIAVGVNSKTSNTNSDNSSDNIKASTSHAIIKSSCSITLHPDLCYSTLSNNPEITKKVKTSKDVIELAINKTKEVIQRNHVGIKILTTRTGLSKREKIALQDCLELVEGTIEKLNKVVEFLETCPTKKRLRKHVDDIITLMSTSLTNQETCIDGFSHSKRDRKVRESLIDGEINGGKMCSNSLAMIKNMTDTDMANEVQIKGRKLVDEKWPEWLSKRDRKLLQSGTVTPNVVVAADGSGDFTTVSAAVAAAPNRSTTRFVISIAAGVYRENVNIPSNKQNLMFIGAGRISTVITANRSVGGGVTTFNSATVADKSYSEWRPWEVLSVEQALDQITYGGKWYSKPLGAFTTVPPYIQNWNELSGAQCSRNPHFWVIDDGSYQEEGQKNTRGYILGKAGTKLVCAVLFLPVHSQSLPDYFHQSAPRKLLLIGCCGYGTSTIFKQRRRKK